MMEQYEKDKEIERLNKVVSRLEELLSVSEKQYASVEQIVARLQEQLNEANKVLLPMKYTPSYSIGINLYDVHRYLDKWGVK